MRKGSALSVPLPAEGHEASIWRRQNKKTERWILDEVDQLLNDRSECKVKTICQLRLFVKFLIFFLASRHKFDMLITNLGCLVLLGLRAVLL